MTLNTARKIEWAFKEAKIMIKMIRMKIGKIHYRQTAFALHLANKS